MDELLHKRLLKKDEKAFNQIVEEHSKLLWAVASTIITSRTSEARLDIEEVVSDVFLRFWQHPEKYDASKGTLKNYLALMTKSMAINKIKSKVKHDHELLEDIHLETIAEKKSENEIWQLLYDAIMEEDEPTRQILLCRFFYEMKPAEISKQTGLPAKEVENRLYRGKKKMKEHFERNQFVMESI